MTLNRCLVQQLYLASGQRKDSSFGALVCYQNVSAICLTTNSVFMRTQRETRGLTEIRQNKWSTLTITVSGKDLMNPHVLNLAQVQVSHTRWCELGDGFLWIGGHLDENKL